MNLFLVAMNMERRWVRQLRMWEWSGYMSIRLVTNTFANLLKYFLCVAASEDYFSVTKWQFWTKIIWLVLEWSLNRSSISWIAFWIFELSPPKFLSKISNKLFAASTLSSDSFCSRVYFKLSPISSKKYRNTTFNSFLSFYLRFVWNSLESID